jgi:hypothetical protein
VIGTGDDKVCSAMKNRIAFEKRGIISGSALNSYKN